MSRHTFDRTGQESLHYVREQEASCLGRFVEIVGYYLRNRILRRTEVEWDPAQRTLLYGSLSGNEIRVFFSSLGVSCMVRIAFAGTFSPLMGELWVISRGDLVLKAGAGSEIMQTPGCVAVFIFAPLFSIENLVSNALGNVCV